MKCSIRASQSIHKIPIILLILVTAVSCESFLEVELPKSRVVSETVYKDEGTAVAAISGIYHQMMYNGGFASGSFGSVTLVSGISADELVNYYDVTHYVEFYQNEITIRNSSNNSLWGSCYETIYAANAIMEGMANSTSLKNETKMQLEGESRFVRAFCYFYLVNLYGDVPLVRSTDYRVNSALPRAPVDQVYAFIADDLNKAKELLSADYISVERVRPNKAAAAALLARTYLYMKNWEKAEEQASVVISNSRYSLAADVNQVFLANSSEAIWQIINPGANTRTNEAAMFVLVSAPIGSSNPVALSDAVVSSFGAGDLRKQNWVGAVVSGANTYYYPWKYKNLTLGTPTTEYSMVLRLAEQYMIRAEARAMRDNLPGAIADLDVIRNRAHHFPLVKDANPGITKEDLLLAIEEERKLELFAEWGHRWLDLKRTGRTNALLSGKPHWDDTDVLYPIPEQEILNDPNLKPQNDGY